MFEWHTPAAYVLTDLETGGTHVLVDNGCFQKKKTYVAFHVKNC